MASKPFNRWEGPSPSVIRLDSPSAAKASWTSSSIDDDPILREVENYVAEAGEVDSVDILVEGDDSGEGSLVGGEMCGFTTSLIDAPLAGMSGDPDHPFFTADVTVPRTRNKDIVQAYKEGYIDGRWFDYLLPDAHFRSSLLLLQFLLVYTLAFTTGMTLPVHPFVKDFFHHHGISPAQL